MAEDKTNGADAPEEKKEDTAPEAPKEETKPEAKEAPKPEPKEEPKQEVAEPKADDKERVEIPKKFAKLVDELGAMSTLELSELVKVLESHFGVSAAAPMAMAAAPSGSEAGSPGGAEEKKEFTVTLTDAGAQKVAVIKAVKEVTGLGLGEAKAIVDAAPKAVKENVPKDEADEAKAKLEEAGATVELS